MRWTHREIIGLLQHILDGVDVKDNYSRLINKWQELGNAWSVRTIVGLLNQIRDKQ